MREYKGKTLKKIEWQELKAIGITEEALKENYNNSDIDIYIDNDDNIYEFNSTDGGYVGDWTKATFIQWFNEI